MNSRRLTLFLLISFFSLFGGVGLIAQETVVAILFDRKEGPGQIRSELVFLDEEGLGVAVTESMVDFRSGRYLDQEVELVAHDPVSRLTLVRVPLLEGEKSKPVELGSSLLLQQGSPLYLAVEGDTSLSRFVSRESEYKDQPLPLELFRVHHQSDTRPFLGHPFFDSAGRLVAINYRSASEFGNGSFAYPVEVVARIQEATVVDGVVQRSWFGVELLASDPFAIVQGVRSASPAAKAGIVKGDILLQIGPRLVRNYAEALNAFFYLREDEKASVKFLRETELLEVEVVPELVPVTPPATTVELETVEEEG